jgi:hypothetical protein
MVGLNISSAFNSAKVIYIIVPLLIIPQLLFSGVIVKFDKLNPVFSQSNEVPWLGNLMAARWAYEALAVVQSTENRYEKKFYKLNKEKSNAAWKKDFWLPEVSKHISKLSKNNLKATEFEETRTLLINEIYKEENNWSNFKCSSCKEELEKLKINSNKTIVIAGINQFLSILKSQYIDIKNKKTIEIEQLINEIGDQKYQYLKNNNQNESLQDVVTNRRELEKIVNSDNELTQKDNPIYNDPKGKRFLDSHFYSPVKYIFGQKVSTFWSNIVVLWMMTVFFAISLYYEWLKNIILNIEFYVQKIGEKSDE